MNDLFWSRKKVLVTGGGGFIGSHVVEKLINRGARVTVMDSFSIRKSKNIDHLKSSVRVLNTDYGDLKASRLACKGQEIVFNLAAKVGGIDYNRKHQGSMLYNNLIIPSVILEAARVENVERFLVVSSACVYPHNATIPTPEEEGFRGEPEPTNSGYGWAKRMSELLGKYYSDEFGIKVGIVRPYNAYGPRDHFDSNSSHVIPSLITKFFSNEDTINVWGSGKQTRAFLYVEDLAESMIKSIEVNPIPEAINLGSTEEITIKDLVEMIIKITGIKKNIIFDKSKPDGSPRRNSDNNRALRVLKEISKTPLQKGLSKTIDWYKSVYL